MICEYTGIMILECDLHFMFCVTTFLVLYFMDTYLATWLVVSMRDKSQHLAPRKKVLQIGLLAPDARDDAVVP